MLKSQASVATPMAEQFLFKLAKHFAKKIPVQQASHQAQLRFEFGDCRMSIAGEGESLALVFDCETPDAATQQRLHWVLDAHLELLTRREPLRPVWRALES